MDELGLREIEIVSTPIHTTDAMTAKERIVVQAEFCPAVMRVVEEILKQDRKRIAAG
jgi:hypothetical protein